MPHRGTTGQEGEALGEADASRVEPSEALITLDHEGPVPGLLTQAVQLTVLLRGDGVCVGRLGKGGGVNGWYKPYP